MLSTVNAKVAYLVALIGVALSHVTVSYAADSSLTDETKMKSGLTTALENFAEIYRVWSIPFIIVAIIAFLLTKDDKKKELEKKTIIGLLVVYVLSFFVGAIINLVYKSANAFAPTSTTGGT